MDMFIGLLFGVAIGVTAAAWRTDHVDNRVAVKDACEAQLPRDQQCVLHYLPAEKGQTP